MRLIFSSTRLEEELGKIRKMNNDLRQLTQDTELLNVVRPDLRITGRSGLLDDAKTMRRHYVSLFESLTDTKLFACDCEKEHFASLRLEPKPITLNREFEGENTEDPYFNFRLLVVSECVKEGETTKPQFQEFEVRPLKYDTRYKGIFLTQLPWPSEGPQIQNICSDVLQSTHSDPGSSIGFLTDVKKLSLRQRLYPIAQTEELRASSLRSLLDQDKSTRQEHALTRCDRLFLAVTLACSMLQIGETAWLQRFWSSGDIVLMHPKGGVCRDLVSKKMYPYIDWSSPSLNGQLNDQFDFPEDEAAVVRSKSMSALGLTLVELCFGRPLSSMREPEDERAKAAGTDFATARRLLYDLELQEGRIYRGIVDKCLHSRFETETFEYDKEQFQEAVYRNVIFPLVGMFDEFRGLEPSIRSHRRPAPRTFDKPVTEGMYALDRFGWEYPGHSWQWCGDIR